ncbi:MAG: hypothetical protein LBD46_05135 [Endomicrobium sp.]|jgi:hypothetical protein|nr:hypothetical protein [Endomicrobium sp.]
MKEKTKKMIIILTFAFFCASATIMVITRLFGLTFFKLSKPTLQMINNLTPENERRIAEIAGLDANHKILYVEKWKDRGSVLIIWMTNNGNIEKIIPYVNDSDKTEKVRKYDPLSRTFVTGDYYENNSSFVIIYSYKNYFGNFIRYQIRFVSSGALNSVLDIFQGHKEYAAGRLEDYDLWRFQLDQQYK